VAGLLSGARRFFVREVRLTPAERQMIRQQTGWSADEDFYRFYIGRDEQGRVVAATVFLTEFTIHGPVRVAVALGPDGKVKGATVVELTEETYPWVKPLLDREFTREYVGRDARGTFTVSAGGGDSMAQFYGQIIASLIQRAAMLYEVGVIKRGDAA
jgi:Na+-translocating ferredoxin:NAD+ oxidoreductase RnfG subunit